MNPNPGDEVLYVFFTWLMALLGPTQIISAILLVRRGRYVGFASRRDGLRRPALPAVLGVPDNQVLIETGARVWKRALFYFLYGIVFTGVGIFCFYRFAMAAPNLLAWVILTIGLIVVAMLVRWFVAEPRK